MEMRCRIYSVMTLKRLFPGRIFIEAGKLNDVKDALRDLLELSGARIR